MEVAVGDGASRLVLRDAELDRSESYAGGGLIVELHAAGLDVTRRVFMYGNSDLEGFVQGLADSWRGWSDVRSWESPEHDLAIDARFEGGGRVVLRIAVQDGPVNSWTAVVEELRIDAGEDMASLARDVRRLLGADG